ncbi:MAG: hypothetical protein ACYDAJ_07905 [Nitrosotalea sp.]
MLFDIQKIMLNLASERPIFHLEADFQHALGWIIQKQYPSYSIRFEYKPPFTNSRIYTDLWIKIDDENYCAMELKYKKRKLKVNWNNENYDLADDGAQDLGRYDFLKDIQRLESLGSHTDKVTKYAIMLTNDSAYWKLPGDAETFGDDFRIHTGVNIHGELKWHQNASDGTTKGRTNPIIINGTYPVKWQDYSKFTEKNYETFKYLLVETL